MIFLQLFYEFFKVGLFAVGGGLATLPFLKAIAQKYPWFTMSDLMDMIAVSESTPGPMGVNSASYAGFHAAGLPGAVAATFSLRYHYYSGVACTRTIPLLAARSERLLWPAPGVRRTYFRRDAQRFHVLAALS